MDIVTIEQRSKNMSLIRSKNTKPEMILRKVLHAHGYRYSLHKNNLPGKPDLYLKKHNTVVFIHGCFWHLHKDCKDAHMPKSNLDFWENKLLKNAERDIANKNILLGLGYNVITFWQCEITDKSRKHIKTEQIISKMKRNLRSYNRNE